MKQHVFSQNCLQFTIGWDGFLRRFFLVIEKMQTASPFENPYVFNTATLPNPDVDLCLIRDKCKENGLVIPDETEAQLLVDAGATEYQEFDHWQVRLHA